MNTLLDPAVLFLLTSFPLVAVCLNPVPVQFEKTPVLVASGTDAIFTVQTVSDVSLIRWTDIGGLTLAMWANGGPIIVENLPYKGRISVTATQLRITNSQLRDSGNYIVSVEPSSTTGLDVNSRSVQLKVFDAVTGVSLSLPSLPLEGRNVSLNCSWTGSEVSVVWGKGGAALTSDTRITVSAGSVVIRPARRDDAGDYTCTVSNAVSAQTAKATLTVYYGPDAPQLTKTSSACVGGGDATVGQAVSLTCTSTSLPPASFSWELNGQPVTAGQSGSGVLNLQIFSTNQSGSYACTAKNDITGGASKQQIDLAIVGVCLNGGAVAGIVVACFVALIIIIIVIIVLLRQRNADRRLREALGHQKTNQNQNESTIIANRALVNENQPDPTLHNSLSQNVSANPSNNNGNINTMPQNIPSSNPLQHNGHVNHNFNTLPDNGHLNNNSYPNNDTQRSFPQPAQHNPNILIQTGSSQPGAPAHTVHVNLNTLPRTDQFNNAQPQTVHVNLNTYPPEANQPNQAIRQNEDQRVSALQSQHMNGNHQNLSQTGLLNSEPLSLGNRTQTMLSNVSTSGSRPPNTLIQTSHSHPANQTNPNQRPSNSWSSAEERTRHSNPVRTDTRTNTHLQQMPWDRLRGTPAYPNHELDSSDSSGSSDRRSRSPQRNAQRGRSGDRNGETEHADRTTQATPASQRGDRQRQIARNELSHSQLEPNVQRQVIQQPQLQTTVPQIQTSQGQNPIHIGLPLGTTTSQTQTVTSPHQTVAQPSVPLTQAALRQHTAQMGNPSYNRTQAALQTPGPSQPIQQLNKAGQRPPTPPPVLRVDEFQMLPRERMQKARNVQPVNGQRRHRSPNMQRRTRVHTSPQRLPGMHPMHGHPMHMRQVHRGRPRR